MNNHEFHLERGGKLCYLVKHPRDRKLPGDEQALRPWYVRVESDGKRSWKKVGEAHETDDAVAAARALLLKARAGGNPFVELVKATRYRAELTVGAVVDAWVAAGYPETNGQRRSEAQGERQAARLLCCLTFWRDKGVSSVNVPMMHDFARWRRGKCREGFAGDRSVDCELLTISNALQWAVSVGMAAENPFAGRPRFQSSNDVEHCNEFMPANDEELHRIAGTLISRHKPADVVRGAQLLFQALTGLRSAEPGFLRWDAQFAAGRPQPGHRYKVILDGRERELLAVHRLKGGINPGVEVHPALAAFIAAWQPYCAARWPESPFWFPDPSDPSQPFILPGDDGKRLCLADVVEALGLPERIPHAMRAFYVRVRRSQGCRDAIIAEELGQGSGPKQIVNVYGDPRGIFGDGRYDWLPDGAEGSPRPAWELIGRPNLNIVGLR